MTPYIYGRPCSVYLRATLFGGRARWQPVQDAVGHPRRYHVGRDVFAPMRMVHFNCPSNKSGPRRQWQPRPPPPLRLCGDVGYQDPKPRPTAARAPSPLTKHQCAAQRQAPAPPRHCKSASRLSPLVACKSASSEQRRLLANPIP